MSETSEVTTEQRIAALAKFLDESVDDIRDVAWDKSGTTFETANGEYRVLTDDEADEACKEYIRDSAWAFNASFISAHTRRGLDTAAQKSLEKVQAELCEGANDLVLNMIEDFDHFASDAIKADGRGHFLSQYDGEENEETIDVVRNGEIVEKRWFYIYRTN